MRRFYALVKRRHQETFDVDEAARLEVRWWVVHRQLFGQADHQPLADALADLYAATFGTPREQVLPAAEHRAQAMIYSDRWVNEGRASGSPLLASVEAELLQSYSALLSAVSPAEAAPPIAAGAR